MLPNKLILAFIIVCWLIVSCRAETGTLPSPTILPSATSTQLVPTLTRTRPARSFFIRPTLVETPSPISIEITRLVTPINSEPYPGPDPNNPTPISPTNAPDQPEQTRPARTANPTVPNRTPTSSPTAAPTAANAEIQSPALLWISMIDTEHGWGLTDRYILRTSNGGQKWINTTPGGNFPPNSIIIGFFINSNEGWALIPSSDLSTGTLYRTKDGGNSWQNWAVGFGQATLFFLDSQNGWAMADRGSTVGRQAVDIYQTIDGGATWSVIHQVSFEIPDSSGRLPLAGTKNNISFRSFDVGWVTGSIQSPGQSWLFISQDSGNSWTQQNLALPAGSQNSTLIIFSPYFFDDLEGVLPVRQLQVSTLTNLFLTDDGGETWTTTTPVAIIGPLDCVSPLACRVFNGINLASTNDGGVTWLQTRANVDMRQSLVQVDFVTPEIGYALSVLGPGLSQLYRTTDGGKNWVLTW